jgi:hypothetical protein
MIAGGAKATSSSKNRKGVRVTFEEDSSMRKLLNSGSLLSALIATPDTTM